jgi:putative lipase involved disintegration of autophagic bodies
MYITLSLYIHPLCACFAAKSCCEKCCIEHEIAAYHFEKLTSEPLNVYQELGLLDHMAGNFISSF